MPFALVPLFAASLAQAAEHTGGRQWIGADGPDRSTLVYGTPDSDDILVGFSCGRVTRELVVSFAFEPVGASDGMQLDMELYSEGGAALLTATGERMLLDEAFVLEARTTLDPVLRRIIAEGETLSIMVQDSAEEIPLAGAAEQAAGLFEACG